MEAFRLVDEGKVRFVKGRLPRSVYKVKIHGDKTVDELSFLDWNKPVPASMRAKVDAAVLEIYPEGVPPWFRNPEQTGGELYKALTKELEWDKQRASMLLLKHGIDGMRVTAEEDGAPPNFVVFDDRAVEIQDRVDFAEEAGNPAVNTADRFRQTVRDVWAGKRTWMRFFELGHASEPLRLAGLPNAPIRMFRGVLSKATQENHPFPKEKFLELPEKLQNPVAVFESDTHTGEFVVLTEIEHEGNSFVVPLVVRAENDGIVVSHIKSVYPKNNPSALTGWVAKGLTRYYNRRKLREFLARNFGSNKASPTETNLGLQLPKAWETLLSDGNIPTDARVSQADFAEEARDSRGERLSAADSAARAKMLSERGTERINIVRSPDRVPSLNQKEAIAFAKKEFAGDSFVNDDTGKSFVVTPGGIDKMIGQGNKGFTRERIAAIYRLPQLIRDAKGVSLPDGGGSLRVAAAYHLYVPFEWRGMVYRVRLLAREFNDSSLPDVHSYRIEDIVVEGDEAGISGEPQVGENAEADGEKHDPPTSPTMTVAELFNEGKPQVDFAEDARDSRGDRLSAHDFAISPTLDADVETALNRDTSKGNPVGKRTRIEFSETPPLLKFVGIPNAKIESTAGIVRKLQDDHGFTKEQIAGLPERYASPVAVFKDGDGFAILTDFLVPNLGGTMKPVMVFLRPDVKTKNFLASAYSRTATGEEAYLNWANRKGGLLFLDDTKIANIGLEDGTLSQLKPQARVGNFLGPADFENWLRSQGPNTSGTNKRDGDSAGNSPVSTDPASFDYQPSSADEWFLKSKPTMTDGTNAQPLPNTPPDQSGASGAVHGELFRLGKNLYGNRVPAGGYESEGFAEFFKLFLLDPEKAQAIATATFKWWNEDVLDINPRLKEKLLETQAAGMQWQRQGSQARAQHSIGKAELSAKETIDNTRRRLSASTFRRLFIESAADLDDFVQEAVRKSGRKLSEEENPFAILTARRLSADSKALYMATKGMINFNGDKVGRPLQDAFAGLINEGKDKVSQFITYLWARRSMALWDDQNGPRNPGLTREDAAQIIDELESDNFRRRAQMVYDWNQGVLDYAAQSSKSFRHLVEKINKVDPGSYIPLFREFDELDRNYRRFNSGGGAGGVRGKNLVKRLKGSGRNIKPPVESMVSQAKEIILKADQMHILDKALNLAEKVPGMGHWISEVPRTSVPSVMTNAQQLADKLEAILKEGGGSLQIEPGSLNLEEEMTSFFTKAVIPPKGHPQEGFAYIPAFRDGKIRWYEVDIGLYETLGAMDSAVNAAWQTVVGKAFRVHAQAFRLGTTGLRATFSLVTNPLRDFRTLYYNSRSGRNGMVIFANWIGSLFSIAANSLTGGRAMRNNTYVQFKDVFDRMGLTMSGTLTQDSQPLKIASRRVGRGGKWNPRELRDYYDILLTVFQFPESASRVAELKMIAEREGWTPGMPMTTRQATAFANAAKQVTTDFTRSGRYARNINMAVPFFNASIQGKKAAYDAFMRNPVRWIFTRGLLVSLLAIANWWRNKDEEWWRDMTDSERFAFDYIEIGDELLRLPRAFDVDTFFMGATTAIIDGLYASEPERVKNWFRDAFEEFSVVGSLEGLGPTGVGKPGLSLDALPPAIKEAIQQAGNFDAFAKRPIVPRGEQDMSPEEQYSFGTNKLSILIGRILGESPRRIDHAISGTFGGVGRDLSNLSGRGDSYVGSAPGVVGSEPADIFILGTLFRRGGTAPVRSVSVDKLYDAYGRMVQRSRSTKHEEDSDQKMERMALHSALEAVQEIRRHIAVTSDLGQRRELHRLEARTAREALAALKSGDIIAERGELKALASEHKEEANEKRKDLGIKLKK
ncbi:MAG: hypothetical protein LBD01_03170 [Puniceicoccales bacterium]|nr:hypothetical protein [Puniceicoccales bacterium]